MDISELDNSSDDLWSIVWKSFKNASLTYDLATTGNGTKISNLDENEFFENPTKLGILTGLLLAWLAEIQIIPTTFDHSAEMIIRGLIFIVLNVSCFIILTPIVSLILMCFFIYRWIIHVILKISMGKNYAGLLEGIDCVWAMEDSSALSVINILAILEITDNLGPSAVDEINLVEDFRNLVKNRLISLDFDKLCWLREKKYGYYYWRKIDYVNLEERVRWLDDDDTDHKDCDGTCYDIYGGHLKKIIAKMSNKPLPQNHSACWEILIPKKCPKSSINNYQLKKKVPLFFRVHHSLGDGVALLRLLLEAIADSKNEIDTQSRNQSFLSINEKILIKSEDENTNCEIDDKPVRLPMLRKSSSLYENYREASEIIYYSKDLLDATMPFSKIIPLKKIFRWWKKNLQNFRRKMIALLSIPSCLYYQALRSMDDSSALHGPALTGDKIISYWMEDDSKDTKGYSLLEKIRDIKNVTDTKFGDVVLAALSANLNNYFIQIGKVSPKTLTVVLPARMTLPNQKLSLSNRFSLGLLPLCISEVNGVCDNYQSGNSLKLLDRLRDVSASTDKLKSDPDYLINYWVMKWLCPTLPEYFIRPFLQSNSSIVFSNLPGPGTVEILGHILEKVAFWIPHRGTTGIGFSFLTYGGNVHFSVTADKAVIDDENALNDILEGTIRNIEQLHANIILPCFKK